MTQTHKIGAIVSAALVLMAAAVWWIAARGPDREIVLAPVQAAQR
jgi:hypothetical protein